MQRELKLKLHVGANWGGLAGEDWLPRFVRTLEAGGRRGPRWTLRFLDGSEGRIGWEARADLDDRTQRLSLFAEGAEGDREPAAAEWTLSVESGPPERAPGLRGGEWWVGAVLAAAAYLAARERMGILAALGCAIAVLLGCGILPHLFSRELPVLGDEPDQTDAELLERVLRGAQAFAGFELATHEWKEPAL